MQLRNGQHAGRRQTVDNGFLLSDVSVPGLFQSDAGGSCHDEHATAQLVAQANGSGVHGRELFTGGRRCGDDHGLYGVSPCRGLQRFLPSDVVSDRGRNTGPTVAAIEACRFNLGFQVAGWDAQFGVQIALRIQRDQLADVLRGGANKQEIALNLGHSTLAKIEIVNADCAECHAVPR